MNSISEIMPLKCWVQKVLPLVYDDSLSYYELLNKVVKKLNDLIDNNNNLPEYIKQTILDMLTPESVEEMLSEIFDDLRHNIAVGDDGESTTSTADRVVNSWVWLNDDLYVVARTINIGDAYVTSGNNPNVIKKSVEELVKDINDTFNDIKEAITSEDEGTKTTASKNRDLGDLVWLNNILYIITGVMNTGDAYVEGTNCKQITLAEITNNVMYEDNELLVIHGVIKSSTIITSGDYHEYNIGREAINIRKV